MIDLNGPQDGNSAAYSVNDAGQIAGVSRALPALPPVSSMPVEP